MALGVNWHNIAAMAHIFDLCVIVDFGRAQWLQTKGLDFFSLIY